MRQIRITRVGPPEVRNLRATPDPLPPAGEARIRLEDRKNAGKVVLVRRGGISFAWNV